MTNIVLPLDAARAEIDAIDDQILDLIERRLAAAAAIAAAKAPDTRLKLRPSRQAEVIARLQRRANAASPQAIRAVWRELMAHSLEAQAPTRLIVAPGADLRLTGALRGAFGSAPAIEYAGSAADALDRAATEEAVAILAEAPAVLAEGLLPFQKLLAEDGTPLGIAIGRIAPEDSLEILAPAQPWSPSSWRVRKTAQAPLYPDASELAAVETELAAAPPVVTAPGAAALRQAIANAARGQCFLLQAGDCAEGFEGFTAERVQADRALLLHLGRTLGGDVVHVARAAGQFAKPRSVSLESCGGTTLPSYRGDAVNGTGFTHAARRADPRRLLRAHGQSRATAALLEAYGEAEGLAGRAAPVWTSHEALLLPYEEALTRRDPETGRWWSLSGHTVWIGDRTRELDGAHVEYAAGIANTIGLKCGPGLSPDALLGLAARLDPGNEAGRLVLIGRFGADRIGEHLPALMRATRNAGLNALWVCDPMHGNGRSAGARKTRYLSDIAAEAEAFVDIAAAEGVHAGGLHLETTGADVTECVGAGTGEGDLDRRYETLCDPRLNPAQALALAERLAAKLRPALARVSSAA
ncbi:MAG TPA: 3-deoxy-7-phosphoheptulonate synthase [Allosphingosinicella sp.]|jgi:3-deoxy-7-phosphoheptulonate synthase